MVDDTRLELVKACRFAPGLQPPVPLELRSSSNQVTSPSRDFQAKKKTYGSIEP